MYGQQEFVADGVVLAATQGLDALGEAATQGLNALGGAAAPGQAANAAPAPVPAAADETGAGADRVPTPTVQAVAEAELASKSLAMRASAKSITPENPCKRPADWDGTSGRRVVSNPLQSTSGMR